MVNIKMSVINIIGSKVEKKFHRIRLHKNGTTHMNSLWVDEYWFIQATGFRKANGIEMLLI